MTNERRHTKRTAASQAGKPRKKTRDTKAIVLIRHGKPFTTTLGVAAGVGLGHASVIKLARKYQADFSEFGTFGFQIQKSGGRETEYAELNEDQATYLMTLFRNTEIVRAFKIKLVKAFRAAVNEIGRLRQLHVDPAWQSSRVEGKTSRRELTDALQAFIGYARDRGSRSPDRYWTNVTKMVSVALFGDMADRDSLSPEQLRLLGMAEIVAARALRDGVADAAPYKGVFQVAKSKVEQFAALVGSDRLPALAS